MAVTMTVMSTARIPTSISYRLAALTVSLDSARDVDTIQLLPAGRFRSEDGSGRPEDVPYWQVDAEVAQRLIAQFEARGQDCVIDYEHQTLSVEDNGAPAPAAGWIKRLHWREGQGLYADVTWNARAREYIRAQEYRFISPVFAYDTQGRALMILHAALTNNPALPGMDEVRLAAARALSKITALKTAPDGAGKSVITVKDVSMNEELLKLLRALLGLGETASEADILAALPAFSAKLTADQEKLAELTAKDNDAAKPTATEEELAKLSGEAEELKKEVAALRAGRIDPAKYVPASALATLQAQVNQLHDAQTERQVDEIVVAALSAKKLTPALEPWARDLGKKDMAALRAYVGAAAPIAALSGQQTVALKIGEGSNAQTLTDAELAICRATGVDPAQYAKHRA